MGYRIKSNKSIWSRVLILCWGIRVSGVMVVFPFEESGHFIKQHDKINTQNAQYQPLLNTTTRNKVRNSS